MFAADKNDSLDTALAVLPERIARSIARCMPEKPVEEIRLRVARPVQIVTADGEFFPESAAFTAEEAARLLERLCMHSVYAHTEELKNGFVTLPGGARVGVCGRPAVDNGSIIGLTEAYCFNFRIARQVVGCAEGVMRFLLNCGEPVSALIVSPPGGGKTTLLRDIARCLSEGISAPPVKVAIADERGELAGCIDGVPSFDIGRRTDVMENAPKAQSIGLLIRSMSPRVIITDELGGRDDAEAVAEACRCGAAVIASAHASSVEELIAQHEFSGLFGSGGVFK